ncbi:hypothetical protein PAHAL_2G006600 [Panicum hallii]|uniref:3'-5' exonuclease domain-containing protein n=1 Tax=Panicum hallii TaxID=206008 RepID=A0A2S3GVJ1_9POAL|nr:hypothetical protein PAHAL_2G006600 [Panicum hallii]
MDGAVPVSTRLRCSTPSHDAYAVRVYDSRFAALATACPADVATTRWLHRGLHLQGRLLIGLGVQWTPTHLPLHGAPPAPATLQLCVGHRCLLFHLAHADAVPEALGRFLADPRVTFVSSGSTNDRRMLWAHYGLHVGRASELRAVTGMGNASLEDMADRILGYPGIHKPREVAMSAWHAPRLSPDQVQYACVDAYLAFRRPHPLPRRRTALPPHCSAPRATSRPAPAARSRPCPRGGASRPAPAARSRPRPPAASCPAPRPRPRPRTPVVFEWSPRAFSGGSMPAVVGVDAAIRSNKAASLTDSDMDSEADYDDDVGGTATHGLPIRAYASDSDDITDSSYGFQRVRFGAFTDDEEDEDINSNGDDQEDEEGCNEDDREDEEGYEEYTKTRIFTHDNKMDGFGEFVGNWVAPANVDDGGGYQAYEYPSHSEVMLDNGEDALAQDDWYGQEVDYGCDQDDEDEYDEFYLL